MLSWKIYTKFCIKLAFRVKSIQTLSYFASNLILTKSILQTRFHSKSLSKCSLKHTFHIALLFCWTLLVFGLYVRCQSFLLVTFLVSIEKIFICFNSKVCICGFRFLNLKRGYWCTNLKICFHCLFYMHKFFQV